MPEITVVNGPNLAALGRREPDIYGDETLDAILSRISSEAVSLGLNVTGFQSDIEGELVMAVGEASARGGALIINPGAYSHHSIALLDAMKAFPGPVIEVHLSNVHAREPFRRQLLTAMGADAVISGAGATGYSLALVLAFNLLRR